MRAFAVSSLFALAFVLPGCGPSEALKASKTPAEASAASPEYAAGWAAYMKSDYSGALRKWLPLAEHGVARAQVSVGQIYEFNLTPPNYMEAASWYEKASEQGDAQGQINLGAMYMSGLGVPQNYILAHMWSNLGSSRATDENTRDPAIDNLHFIETKMTDTQIGEAQKLAREWKPK